MDCTLLVCKKIEKEKFDKEKFTGKDDILALVERGRFFFDAGNGVEEVGQFEAVNFKKDKCYTRKMLEKTSMYLFRYKTDRPVFHSDKITFQDVGRIRSTIELLKSSDSDFDANDFAYKKSLFSDLVTQYRLENMKSRRDKVEKDPVVSSAMATIRANIHKKLNLAHIAADGFLSYVQFSRRFKCAVGTSPQEYVADVRMKRARMLLEETELPIKEIASGCGFANEYYFSNFFRKYNGVSPSEFREIAKSDNKP